MQTFCALSRVFLNWATPPVRLGLSRRNSGKNPERPRKRSQSVSWNPLESTAGIAQTLQLKAFEGSRAFPELSPPQYGWGRFFLKSGSGEGLSEPVMEFPAVLGYF